MKLWQKNNDSLKEVTRFTVGQDRELDLQLAPFDVLGSLAHIQMLTEIGILNKDEKSVLKAGLKKIYEDIVKGEFKIEEGVEDIHSQVEHLLTTRLGDIGKKIHSGRSRNDQVLVDSKLLIRHKIQEIVERIQPLFQLLIEKSKQYQETLLPGYTHLQLAMPSSFGLWFGAYAESLADDLIVLQGAYRIANKNPLGSGAGYGSSFPLDRKLTTQLLGFDDLHYNVVYAQMSRGKTEKITAAALSNIASTLGKLAMDACLYLNQNFAFISFPDELTTGSSIMPHKKNPDVFEIIRARCSTLNALPNEIAMLIGNLPSGYHRDLQLLKEKLFPAFQTLLDCLEMTSLMIGQIQVKENILDDPKYKFLFSVEEVNKLVLAGVPFRDAYKQIGLQIEEGRFTYSTALHHTHLGSIGNPGSEHISRNFYAAVEGFHFSSVSKAIHQLLTQ